MALRAVIFDYGMVLTGPQDPGCHQALLRIIGLPPARFESLYWADRHAYDEGKLTGITFWQKLVHEAGLNLAPGTVEQLSNLDARMWSTENPAMLAWQLQLKQRGLLTAILSNMGDNVLASVERTFNWLPRFDVLIWSYQWHMAKPDPAIYRLCLDKLGVRPDESLFLDDKLINVEAAHSLGIKAIHFTTIERLRQDLIAQGLDADIPLP
ncbi:MAG: HAD family phosphatase [Terracidiphilus sp.]